MRSCDSVKEIPPIPIVHHSSHQITEPTNLPLKGKEVLSKYSFYLSEFEKTEILEYDYVYFIGHKAKKIWEDKFDNEKFTCP